MATPSPREQVTNVAQPALEETSLARKRSVAVATRARGRPTSMITKTVQFLAILCVAVAMAAGFAHLLELPNKMPLSREDYLTVQQIYQGWALLGIPIMCALAFSLALTWLERGQGPAFHFALLATVCIALSLVVFFSFTFPVNRATENWTTLPENWEALRLQWEYSHATGAILYLVALGSLVLSVISRRR